MHGRYVDHHVARAEKRSLDSTSAEDGQPDRKRPALARLIPINFWLINNVKHFVCLKLV